MTKLAALRRRRFVGLGAAGLLVLARLLPAHGVVVPLCWYHFAFGVRCPGCGLTRSLSCAVRGMWAESIAYHPLGIAVMLALVAAMVRGAWPRRQSRLSVVAESHGDDLPQAVAE